MPSRMPLTGQRVDRAHERVAQSGRRGARVLAHSCRQRGDVEELTVGPKPAVLGVDLPHDQVGQPLWRRQVGVHGQRQGRGRARRPLAMASARWSSAVAARLVGARHLVEHRQQAIGRQIGRPRQHLARRREQDGRRPPIEVVPIVDIGPAVGVDAHRHQIFSDERGDTAIAVADGVHHRAAMTPGRRDRQQHGLAFGPRPLKGVRAPLQPGKGVRCRQSSCSQAKPL